ncbi:hypothetical protein Bhyg_13118, partial [Pseudolycoriella hygida]
CFRVEMALTNMIMLSQIAGYLVAFILSFCIHIPLTNHYHAFGLTKLVMKEEEQSFLHLFLEVFVGVLNCVLTLSSAIIITLGFIVWCSNMTQRFPSCEIAAGQNITKESEHVHTSDFYIEMGVSQV